MDKKYNGWTNYETWAVALWMDNDHLRHQFWREAANEARSVAPGCKQVADGIWDADQAARFLLADWLKEDFDENAPTSEPTVYCDLLQASLESVAWQEIADHLLEDTEGHTEPNSEQSDEPSVVVSTYTRAQALKDGVLVEVTETAKEVGIKFPAAVTAAVWAQYVEVPSGVECQDKDGRLWDILWMLRCAILGANGQKSDRVDFELFVKNDAGAPRPVKLKALCGPGDDAESVITVMLPEED